MSDIRSFTPLWGVWEIEPISKNRLAIGEGSFGKVYKGIREEFGRKYECAIKHISLPQSDEEVRQLLDEQLSDDLNVASDYYRQIVEDIINEIDIIYSLRGNTNIVAYGDHLIIPKASGVGYDIFIRMELLTELSQRVKQSAFTDDDAVKMGIDICTALEVCAAKSLIHRDIKPQNIFINLEGSYKLGDFGISRQLEKTTSGLSKKGTYSYMAPEIYKGQEYGANVDIYSLGLLMYRLLNGNRLPFLPLEPNPLRYDDNEKALAKRIRGEDIPAPAFASEALSKIILKMCAFDRKERYKTATEAKSDLLHLANAPQKVIPMVAPVGPMSLTDDPVVNDPPIIDDEKTISDFVDLPGLCATPPPPPPEIKKKKASAMLVIGIILGLVGVFVLAKPGVVLRVRLLAILLAVTGCVLSALGLKSKKKKAPAASVSTPHPDAIEKRTRTIAILGLVFGILFGLGSALLFVLSMVYQEPYVATWAIAVAFIGCIINALGLKRKRKALAIVCLVLCVAALIGPLVYHGYHIGGGYTYSWGAYEPNRYGNIFDYLF